MQQVVYRSDMNKTEYSHNVVIYNHFVGNTATKVKMTYQYNEYDEAFDGQVLVNNTWEYFFNMYDLGFERKKFDKDDIFARQDRYKEMEIKGLEFIEKVLR